MFRSSLVLLGCGLLVSCAHVTPKGPALSRTEKRRLKAEGMAAYDKKDFVTCARLLEQAEDPYDAACCLAQGAQLDGAFAQLTLATRRQPVSPAQLQKDSDLEPLRADPRWAGILTQAEQHAREARATQHAELLELFEADQSDRSGDIDWAIVHPRDLARQQRVSALLEAGAPKVSADYLHAAFVFQHGDAPEDIARAHALALKAVELDGENEQARWLAAASLDRKLMYEKKPQKYGTQFTRASDAEPWVLYSVDPSVTDEERAAWNVPTLAEQQARLVRMNAHQ